MSASTARGPYQKGIKRREEIVRSASAVFAEFGYVGGSLRAIAASVGVSPATLVQYFGSKEGLLEAVLEAWTEQAHELYTKELHGLQYFWSLPELMTFHVNNRGLIELFLTMAAEASSLVHPARAFVQRRYGQTFEGFSRHLRESRESGETTLTEQEIATEARMLIATMDGLELQWLIDPAVDLRGLFDEYLDQAIARWTAPRAPRVRRPAT